MSQVQDSKNAECRKEEQYQAAAALNNDV